MCHTRTHARAHRQTRVASWEAARSFLETRDQPPCSGGGAPPPIEAPSIGATALTQVVIVTKPSRWPPCERFYPRWAEMCVFDRLRRRSRPASAPCPLCPLTKERRCQRKTCSWLAPRWLPPSAGLLSWRHNWKRADRAKSDPLHPHKAFLLFCFRLRSPAGG